jgi:hypothetical protein
MLAITSACVLGIVAVVVAAGWLFLRKPHLSGSRAIAIAINIPVSDSSTGATNMGSVTLTDDAVCARILAALREGRLRRDHGGAEVALLTLTYANGKTNEVRLLAREKPDRAEFRHGVLRYSIGNEKLREALQAAGVDISKLSAPQ